MGHHVNLGQVTMALLELLTVGVGNGIAKGVLKLWLKDHTLIQEVGMSVVDMIKGKTGDYFAQRAADRQMERLGEKMAKDLLPIFEAEGEHIPRKGLKAVARIAGETLKETALTPDFLTAYDLQPDQLQQHFLKERPDADRDLSDREKELYRRTLKESCQYIVDVAGNLPSFNERTLAEVLKRETLLLEKADQILDEVRRIRKAQLADVQQHAEFETEYRRAVIRKYDRLELFGVDVEARRYKLSVAYVSLTVETGKEGQEDILPVETLLANHTRLFIKGPPGSGKTTLLQWMAVQAASRKFEGALESWNQRIPFLVRLRDFPDGKLPSPDDFIALAASNLAGDAPKGHARNLLKEGRVMVLVDGLDELPREYRDGARDWLVDLIALFPKASFFISSRPHAAETGWLDQSEFQEASLKDMDKEAITAFIHHWHRAIREELKEAEEIDLLSIYEDRLKVTVQQNRPIRRLAVSPLLCAMLCALHRERRTHLPTDRISLYRACTEMFFRRDLERDIKLGEYPDLKDPQKRLLLNDFAYWLIKNGWSEADISSADKRFQKRMSHMDLAEDVMGGRIRALFAERIGLLRYPSPDKVDFPHRTFQEFFAAEALLAEGDLGMLERHAHDDQWREVVILAAGLARSKEANQIVGDLLNRGDKEPVHRQVLHLLAAACLELAVEVDSQIKEDVGQRLSAFIPPKSISLANELAKAGDLIVPLLKYVKKRTATDLAKCVRALALVETPAAWEALIPYAEDSRKTISNAIVDAAKFVEDRGAYSAQFFNYFKGEELELWNLPNISLEGIGALTQLKKLCITRCNLEDISLLSSLTQLTDLWLFDNKIEDISPLSSLTQLTNLQLYNNKIEDINPLASLNNLATLILYRNEIEDVSPLSSLTQLTNLWLRDNKIENISPLASLTQLTNLQLNNNKIEDISPLASLTQLRFLHLQNNKIEEISALASLTQLGNLYLQNNKIEEISTLASLNKLIHLDLVNNNVQIIRHLASLKFLKHLDLRNNKIKDISPLASLTQLSHLDLYNNKIEDVSPLASLTQLSHLDLYNNKIEDVSPLAPLKKTGTFINT